MLLLFTERQRKSHCLTVHLRKVRRRLNQQSMPRKEKVPVRKVKLPKEEKCQNTRNTRNQKVTGNQKVKMKLTVIVIL